MPRVSLEKLVEQQNDTTKIRNLCIIAHVDHGKTTLCDALISSNGIISERLAGQMRYMDNRKDEQEKLITMKCSSISLLFPPDITDNNYLINLIDSPGHVDFTGEVSSAVRISDGALVLVDVAEGICAQTQTVLRQAWNERVKPCLVLNKIDRLFTELNQTPEEAYYHLHKILESVNVVMANIITEDLVFSDDYNPSLSSEKRNNQNIDGDNNDQPADHEDSYFSPERGNVLFASAVDGWGFRIDHFADLYAKRFGMKREALLKCLWGEYYLKVDKKVENKNNTIKIFTTSQNGKLPRLFVEFVLKNVWQLYNTVFSELSIEKAKKIVQTLKLDVPNRELAALERYQSKSNNKPYKDQALRNVLRSIARKWLPLSESILSMCVDQLPSPVDSQSQRIPKLWRSLPPSSPSPLLDNIKLIENDLYRANKDSEHMVAFISKVFAAPFEGGVVGDAGPRIVVPSARSTLVNSNNSNNSDNELIASLPSHKQRSDEKFIGFARIFCGTIRKGQEVFVLAPKYDPRYPDKHISSFVVNELYSLMGRALEPIEYASAGMVFGIGGIEAHVLKTATLTTLPLIPTFSEVQFSQSIVRVAVEPVNPAEMDILAKGLQLLNQADASVEVLLHDRDQIISAAGELHLERCLRDLKEFAPIDIKVSPPIVSFKETIIEAGKEFTQTMKSSSVSFKIRCTPLPMSVTLFLEQNSERIYQLFGEGIDSKNSHEFTKFNNNFIAKLIDAGHSFTSEFENIWSFGTNRNGPNILFNHIPGYFNSPYWKSICSSYAAKDLNDEDIDNAPTERVNDDDEERVYTKEELKRIKFLLSVDYAIVNGFQYATMNGPLCGEQMRGCAFFIEDFKFDENSENTTFFKGMITSSLTNAFKQSFLNCSTRLVEPFYHCNINVADHMFGKTSGVLFKRRGRITNNERKGTDGFTIEAVIPVVESFGLSDELMKKTSGSASVQLWFSHWEILDIDPNWEPTTEDEIEEFGSNAQARGGNIARQLVDDVRRRKGMFVEEKLVESADKQRNLSKNK